MWTVLVNICLERGEINHITPTEHQWNYLSAFGCRMYSQFVQCPFHLKEKGYHLIEPQVYTRHLVGNLARHVI